MTESQAWTLRPARVICGHISRADQIKWFASRQVIATIRDPVDRCLSFIYYVRSLPPEGWIERAQRLPLLEFIETDTARQNLCNTMVRQLGGHMLDPPSDLPGLLERAKQTLSEALWVGRQSHLDEDLTRLSSRLDIALSPVRENLTASRPRCEDEDRYLLDCLKDWNHFDMRLWEWANAELFGGG